MNKEVSNLEYLTAIIEDSKKQLRLSNKATLVGLDSRTIALKTAKMLEQVEASDLTAWCGKLGKRILQGFEQQPIQDPYNHFEKKQRRLRIHTGWWIFRVLEAEGILYRFRKDIKLMKASQEEWKLIKEGKMKASERKIKEKFQYQLMQTEKGEAIIDGILSEVPVGERNMPGEPVVWRPLERRSFNDTVAGPLVSKYDADDVQHWTKRRIPQVYKVINKLQQTAYRMPKDVYDVVIEWKKQCGGKLWSMDKIVSNEEEAVGLNRDENMTLSYAKQMIGQDFWFYWNLDFRGRKYVMSTYLTPQGSKLAKSLIRFKNREKLGSEGWFWLLQELASAIGYDKKSIDDRFDIVNDNLDFLMEIAKDPVNNLWWFKGCDDKYKTLSCLLEIKKAMAHKGGPYEFCSNIMVGFDATTSGLQVLSWLSRDETTGKHCNLTLDDTLGDSYMLVRDKIMEYIDDPEYYHPKGGSKKQQDDAKAFWRTRLVRSTVKRSVMVKYYKCGASQMGKHIFADEKYNFLGLTEAHAEWLGQVIFTTCDVVLPGPARVMERLTELGLDEFDKGKDYRLQLPVDGFLMIQKYRVDKTSKMNLKGNKQLIQARYIAEPGKYMNKGNVMTGSSVNTIHGIDSQLVSGLTLIAEYDLCPVHDCFSTHAAAAGKMYEDIRKVASQLFKWYRLDTILKQKGYKNKNNIKYGKLRPRWTEENIHCFS